MSKSVQRGSKAPQKAAERKPASPKAPDGSNPGGATQAMSGGEQTELYDKAMVLFSAGEYRQAKDMLDEVAGGPLVEIAHVARTHSVACKRRLAAQARPQLKTPEEQYDYAVTLINRRRPAEAAEYLLDALQSVRGGGDHLHYALAICYGLQGELNKAGDHLRRAIELDPKNRTVARNDPDFDSFMHNPPISALLQPERTNSE